MNRSQRIPLLLTAGFLAVACSLPFGAAQTAVQRADTQGADVGALSSPSGSQPTAVQAGSLNSLMKSFPVPPDSKMESNSADEDDPSSTGGSFLISSSADPAAAINFYATGLPKLGWVLRYTDPNPNCGFTQYWKNNFIYLSLAFRFEESALTIHGEYRRVESQSLEKYLPGFPLPETAELVDSSDIAWTFYIQQDYKAVELFYRQKLLALHWTTGGPEPTVDASCGDPDPAACEGNGARSACPAGLRPIPSPTFDPRHSIVIFYTMPDQNVVQLDIVPHGNATILYVDVTLKGLGSSGLPADIPIFPGAVLQMVVPGTVTYQIDAGLDTVRKFYEEQLKAGGWSPDGDAIEGSGSYLQAWKKGNQKITITIISTGTGSMLVLDCSTCR
jgi:hypothetical protein